MPREKGTMIVLGAADPEMEMIEELLAAAGKEFCYAAVEGRAASWGSVDTRQDDAEARAR